MAPVLYPGSCASVAMIDRKKLVRRHNPLLTHIDHESPLSLGNGELAFTADVTGMQTLYGEYDILPLCTMSQWGFHSTPSTTGGVYAFADVEMTEYVHDGRTYAYASECKPGNEAAYEWRRKNPHRLNLARLGLHWEGRAIQGEELTEIRQELDLYGGVLESVFKIHGVLVRVLGVCAAEDEVLGFALESAALADGRLSLKLDFPYASHRKSASDWVSPQKHQTIWTTGPGGVFFERRLDADGYFVRLDAEGMEVLPCGPHSFSLRSSGVRWAFCLAFSDKNNMRYHSFDGVYDSSVDAWQRFWEEGGAVDFGAARDKRATELERRTVLSQYLCAINCAGSLPPQETGLSCNSWYGKFHLEMHILHGGHFPLWNRPWLLERSLAWYEGILDKARENARRGSYGGVRWPKMCGPEGEDSPSRIAVLLIWQQVHIIYMLELIRWTRPDRERAAFVRQNFELVRETADFIADFFRAGADGCLHLAPPLIPAQEEHAPEISRNPAFELSYFRFGLSLAIQWARWMGRPYGAWERVRAQMAPLPVAGGLYMAHENCPDTFSRFNRDHPSMLFAYGFIPCDVVKPGMMSDTADMVLGSWDWQTAWGWDFALCAMCLTRLGRPEDAIDVLLMETAKNSFVTSGHNFQRGRDDLPLYLPGNGSLLLALSMMLAGYSDVGGRPGFPQNGLWEMECEGILPLPY